MIIGFKILKIGAVPGSEAFKKSTLNAMLREAWEATGEEWGEEYRPKHFTRQGAEEYGYAPRAGEGESGKGFWRSYTGRKQRQMHHTLPLVWSGESRDATVNYRVEATRNGARVVMRAPKLNFRNSKSQIDMRREMTTISEPEAHALAQFFNSRVLRLLRRASGRTETTTIH